MKSTAAQFYRCPACSLPLSLKVNRKRGAEVIDGKLSDRRGHSYQIENGIPILLSGDLLEPDEQIRGYYEKNADSYDHDISFMFKTLREKEDSIRTSLVDTLELTTTSKVLEIGCGSGKDSMIIARRLSGKGRLFLQDISPSMIDLCRGKLSKLKVPVEFSISTGAHLPFPSRAFDAVFHFGGINTFAEKKLGFQEMARVAKVGGRVVVGDEGVPPWYRKTLYGKVLMNANPLFKHRIPLDLIPENARDVDIRWVAGGVFYAIKYTVGDGQPPLNMKIEFPGRRGGTYASRYFGQLEGVEEETKKLALRASEKAGKSMHSWLDEVVKRASRDELER